MSSIWNTDWNELDEVVLGEGPLQVLRHVEPLILLEVVQDQEAALEQVRA
jgi:hypothetical protein